MDDRAAAVDRVIAVGNKLSDIENVEKLSGRWTSLLNSVSSRDSALQDTLQSAKQFTAALQPLREWINAAESLQRNVSLPSADCDVIRAAFTKHNVGTFIFMCETFSL